MAHKRVNRVKRYPKQPTITVGGHPYRITFVNGLNRYIDEHGRNCITPCLINMRRGTVKITRERSPAKLISHIWAAYSILCERHKVTSVDDADFAIPPRRPPRWVVEARRDKLAQQTAG